MRLNVHKSYFSKCGSKSIYSCYPQSDSHLKKLLMCHTDLPCVGGFPSFAVVCTFPGTYLSLPSPRPHVVKEVMYGKMFPTWGSGLCFGVSCISVHPANTLHPLAVQWSGSPSCCKSTGPKKYLRQRMPPQNLTQSCL